MVSVYIQVVHILNWSHHLLLSIHTIMSLIWSVLRISKIAIANTLSIGWRMLFGLVAIRIEFGGCGWLWLMSLIDYIRGIVWDIHVIKFITILI